VAGVTEVDSFLLSLFTGKYGLALSILSQATLIAVTSNNLIKLIYALALGSCKLRKPLVIGFRLLLQQVSCLLLCSLKDKELFNRGDYRILILP